LIKHPAPPDWPGPFAVKIAFDAVSVPGGSQSVQAMAKSGVAKHYLLEAYKHLKPIAVLGDARQLLTALNLPEDAGLVTGEDADVATVFIAFAQALAQHRIWAREPAAEQVPA
jgi:catalase